MKYKKMLSFIVAIAMVFATFTTFSGVDVDAEEAPSYGLEGDSSVVLNKSATYNLETGKVEITLEAYSTADYETSLTAPDIIFNIDVSQSMSDPANPAYIPGPDETPDDYQTRMDVLILSMKEILDKLNTDYESVNVAITTFSDVNKTGYYYKTYPGTAFYQATVLNNSHTWGDLFFDVGSLGTDYTDVWNIIDSLEYDNALSRSDKGLTVVENILDGLVTENTITIFYSDGLPGQSNEDEKENLNKLPQTYDHANIIKSMPTYKNKIYTMVLDGDFVKNFSPNPWAYDLWQESYEPIFDPDENKSYWKFTREEFAEGISSNYVYNKSAKEYQEVIYDPVVDHAYVIDPWDYGNSLVNAFTQISNSFFNVTEYHEEAQLRDFLTPVLELPDVDALGAAAVGEDSVRVYIVGIDTIVGDTYTFNSYGDADEVFETDGIGFEDPQDVGGIFVSGFDYYENKCYEEEPGIYHGAKLVVEIITDLIPGFIGGNLVVTNTSYSGFYDNTFPLGSYVNTFEKVTIDVPLEYIVNPVNKSVYITNGACGLEVLADIVFDDPTTTEVDEFAIYYDQADYFTDPEPDVPLRVGTDFKIDGLVNSYVDITYEFFNPDTNNDGIVDGSDSGLVSLGTLTIANGSSSFTGSAGSIQQLLDDDKRIITVEITVTPTETGTYPTSDYEIYPEIAVVDPTINLHNSTIFQGEMPDDDDFIDESVDDDGIEWTVIADSEYIGCDGTTPLSASTGMPALLISDVLENTTTPFAPPYTIIGTPIAGEVIVMADLATDVNITSQSKYSNPDLALMDPEEDTDINKFYLTVVDGEFTITKTMTEDPFETSEDYTRLLAVDSNQGFIFKIEKFSNSEYTGEADVTFYVALDNAVDTKTIKELSEGYYRVTEEDDWSDKYGATTSYEFFVGRDDNKDFWYVNNDLDGVNGSKDLVDDNIGEGVFDDYLYFDLNVLSFADYPWMGDVAVARNQVIAPE